jgi:hypothetical protein
MIPFPERLDGNRDPDAKPMRDMKAKEASRRQFFSRNRARPILQP